MNRVENKTFIEKDNLNRKEEAKFLVNYLTKRYEVKEEKDSFVLNVNAKWGYGKTFFLNLIKEELKSKNYEVVHFDAWENDFTKEPLLAFFSEINSSLEKYLVAFNQQDRPFLKNIFKNSLPILVSVLTKHLTGLSSEQFQELLEDEENENKEDNTEVEKDTKTTLSSIMSKTTELALKEHNTIKKSIQEFKDNMNTLLGLIKEAGKELPLFILIDELDRCRPNYAIELLENIKHIFNIPGIYFIIATNSKQLSHSINAIYGANFSSQKYLKRFFHQEYNLKEPDEYEFIKFLFDRENLNNSKFFNPLLEENYKDKNLNVILFKSFSNFFMLTLRDIEQCINMLSTIYITWKKEEKIHLVPMLFYIMLESCVSDYFVESRSFFMSDTAIRRLIDNKIINRDFISFKSTNGTIEISKMIGFYYKIMRERGNNKDIFENREVNGITEYKNITDYYFANKPDILEYYSLVKSAAQLK